MLLKLLMITIILLSFGSVDQAVSDKTESGNHQNIAGNALVVGVGLYENWPQIPNAAEDAREVARLFKRFGFAVDLRIDPTSDDLRAALQGLKGKSMNAESPALFYYCGQGETRTHTDGTQLGWLIPVDCPRPDDDPSGFGNAAVSMREIETWSMDVRAGQILMLFDTSVAGDIFNIQKPALRPMDSKKDRSVRQVIIAGSADEPIPAKSAFKRYLIKGLKGEADLIADGQVSGSELSVYLRQRLSRTATGRQHMQYGVIRNPSLSQGDFTFPSIQPMPENGRLFVETVPVGARVRVLNIRPRFKNGMTLKAGRYHVEVSAAGHETVKQWVNLAAGDAPKIVVQLTKIEPSITNSIGMNFVRIVSGSFMMGTSPHEVYRGDDEILHRVSLTNSVYVQTTEVTVAQFREFVNDTGYRTEAEQDSGCWVVTEEGKGWKQNRQRSWKNSGPSDDRVETRTGSHPVSCVTWNDARAFASWISRKEGRGYNLPTEAEWEYACRAGTKTPFAFGTCLTSRQGNFADFGNRFGACATSAAGPQQPTMAGSLIPNAWGLYDMHGNVAEWCRDWYGTYPDRETEDPSGPAVGGERVTRGGHWAGILNDCRSAKRASFKANTASDAIGFRLVLQTSN